MNSGTSISFTSLLVSSLLVIISLFFSYFQRLKLERETIIGAVRADFKNKRDEVETKLSLGADIFSSSIDIIRDSIKNGMLPTIDSTKTLGIVSLPGMMTGNSLFKYSI